MTHNHLLSAEQTNTQRAERSWKRRCWSNSKGGRKRESCKKESSAANVVVVAVVVVEFSVVVGNSFQQAGALQHQMYFYAVFLVSFQS